MRISRLQIRNFRNFRHLDVGLSDQVVVVGPNKVGKSNLIYGLRLALDPSLPDRARDLTFDDFWDGLGAAPFDPEVEIRVDIDLTDYESDVGHMASLADFVVQAEPLVSRLSYAFRRRPDVAEPTKESDYEFLLYGGDDPRKRLTYRTLKRLPVEIMPALRDAEGSLASWRRSPLRPLLDEAAADMDPDALGELAAATDAVAAQLAASEEIAQVAGQLSDLLEQMVGALHTETIVLGHAPTDPEKLVRAVRLLIDEGRRDIHDASVGSSNLILLALQQLGFELLRRQNARDHTFLAIEEPEAHLHPHLQRLIYRHFLRPRSHLLPDAPAPGEAEEGEGADVVAPAATATKLLTTHSPHVVSIAPARSLLLLRSDAANGTTGRSTAHVDLSVKELEDIERYLDVTRAEAVFARGLLLVEGDAELYLVPALASILGVDLDRAGITTAAIHGTHFTSYLRFFGPGGLDLPTAVLTDYDGGEGISRIRRLLSAVFDVEAEEGEGSAEGARELGMRHGLFLGDSTLEADLLTAGQAPGIGQTLLELGTTAPARARGEQLRDGEDPPSPEEVIADIRAIGKGRFAQRLAGNLVSNPDLVPPYIASAIDYLRPTGP